MEVHIRVHSGTPQSTRRLRCSIKIFMLWADVHTIIEFNLRVVYVFARLISPSAKPYL